MCSFEEGMSTGCRAAPVSIRGGGDGTVVEKEVGEQGVGGGVEGDAMGVASARKVDIGGGDIREGLCDVDECEGEVRVFDTAADAR